MTDLRQWISEISTGLIPDSSGGWVSLERGKVSYPEDGHSLCMQVEDRSFWFKHRNSCIVELVRLNPPRGPIFDVGGGNGFVAKGLETLGFDTVLIEPSIQAANNARQRGGVPHIICSGFEEAGFLNHSLPAVGLFDVLEHIQDDKAFLSLIKRKLIPTGRLYVTVPAYPFLWSSEDNFAGHYRRYTLAALSENLVKSGFQIDFASYFFSFLPPIIFLGRTLPSKFRRAKFVNVDEHKVAHTGGSEFITQVLDCIVSPEVFLLKKKVGIPFGGSCLISATAASS